MTEAEKQKLAKNNKDISTAEIKRDIADTQQEIKEYEEEKAVLMKNPPENKARIYLLNGRIAQRQTFIDQLEAILEVRLRE